MSGMVSVTVKITSKDVSHSFKVERPPGMVNEVYVEKIKTTLASLETVNFETQVLMFRGNILRSSTWIPRESDGLHLELHEKILELTLKLPVKRESQQQQQEMKSMKTIQLKVEPSITALEIKRLVTHLEGILSEHQQLKFDGKMLNNHCIITEYGVKNGSELHIEVGKWVTVRMNNTLFVPQSYTVANLLDRVQKDQYLKVGSKRLKLEENVLDCVKDSTSIDLRSNN